MKILNIGSLNIDYFYRVSHFVRPGETLSSTDFECLAGGKGSNQSLALARAGAHVHHVGRIGHDGLFLRELLQRENVNVDDIIVTTTPTGHAIIQVTPEGENAILLYPGANHTFLETEINILFAPSHGPTLLLTQNETNLVSYALAQAAQNNVKIFFNPAPFTKEVMHYPLSKVYCLIVNQTEAQQITGKTEVNEIFPALRKQFPQINFLLTLGEQGVRGWFENQEIRQNIIPTTVVDTTAAGDTFIGYFIACLYQHELTVQESLYKACKAASLCVSRPGAAQSIPRWSEI